MIDIPRGNRKCKKWPIWVTDGLPVDKDGPSIALNGTLFILQVVRIRKKNICFYYQRDDRSSPLSSFFRNGLHEFPSEIISERMFMFPETIFIILSRIIVDRGPLTGRHSSGYQASFVWIIFLEGAKGLQSCATPTLRVSRGGDVVYSATSPRHAVPRRDHEHRDPAR